MAKLTTISKTSRRKREREIRDAALSFCFILALFAVPALTVFSRWYSSHQPSATIAFRPQRALEVFTLGNDERVKFEDIAPAADVSHSTRAQWRRRISGALYNFHQFIADFDEQFTFRETLLSAHARLKLKGIATSRSMEALRGEDGWLFYTDNDAIAQYRRTQPFKNKDLAAWRVFLEREQAFFAQQGIEFLVVVVPEKHTVYPEFMPSYLQPTEAPSRFDQLMAQLSSTKVNILDLRPALKNNKARWPPHSLFYRTDTHWNALGAYVAYESTIQKLREKYSGLRTTPLSQFDVHFREGRSGDLARLLGWQSVLREEHIVFKPKGSQTFPSQDSIFYKDSSGKFQEKIVARTSGAPIQRAIFFADSFVCDTAYLSFLSRHFDQLTVFRNVDEVKTDRGAVQLLKPQLVILEFAERNLATFQPPQH